MLTILGTIGIVLGAIGVGLLIDRKWSVIPRKEKLLEQGRRGLELPGYAPGEAPASAIAATPGEIEELRRKRCAECRGDTETLADDRVRYDGQELVVLHARCRACGRARSTYVRPTGA